MAEKIKYTRKDLKGPDEFISGFSRAVSWGKDNALKIGLVAAVVVLVLAAALGGQAYYRWKETKATRDLWPHLNRAREFMEAPTAADAEKLERLEQFLASYIGIHPQAKATVFARYYLGSIAYLRGNYGLSATQFQAALARGDDKGLMSFLLRHGFAQALEARGDAAAAMNAYRDAAGVSTSELRAVALEGEARMLASMGKKQEAAALYRSILAENPETPMKALIQLRLQQLT